MNHLKIEVQPTPEKTCISNLLDNGQYPTEYSYNEQITVTNLTESYCT